MPPRVLFLDHVGVLGGAELSLIDIATHFRRNGHVVLFEDGPFREALTEAGVSAQVLPAPSSVRSVSRDGGLWHDLRAAPGVVGHARRLARLARSYDLLYANSQKSMVVAGLAGVLARRPVVWHLRDLMTEAHFSRVHRAVAAGVGALATRVIANSHATREAFIRSGGRPGRTFTVHNGIDGRPFGAVRPERARALRRELGVDKAPLIGMFSRLAPWKGQRVLLEALTAMPGVHALFVGDALFQDERRYAGELRQWASDAGVADRAHFLGFRRDVPDLLSSVDVVVHASTAPEPFGRVIVEGMLAGRPVVATAAGGAAEILDHGETGYLVPPGDVAALVGALAGLLAHPDRAREMADAGRRAARERFSPDAMLAAIRGHLDAAAPESQRRRALRPETRLA